MVVEVTMIKQAFKLQLSKSNLGEISNDLVATLEQIQVDAIIELAPRCIQPTHLPIQKTKPAIITLSYRIQLPDSMCSLIQPSKLQLEQDKLPIFWSNRSKENIYFADKLWLNSCLECFLGSNTTEAYVEINASPDGRYAVYEFDAYRTPNNMPPRRLQITHSNVDTNITNEQDESTAKIQWFDTPSDTSDTLQRQYGFNLAQLPTVLQHINQIHPCVILYLSLSQGSHPLYFATSHPAIADFHDKQHWSNLTV